MIRAASALDTEAILEIVNASGLFDQASAEMICRTLSDHFSSPEEAVWLVAETEKIAGVVYYQPEPMTDGTWNVLMLLVHSNFHRQGIGTALMRAVEKAVQQRSGRLLIVETSDQDDFAPARQFYASLGYKAEASIANFYEMGNGKVIFTKTVLSNH